MFRHLSILSLAVLSVENCREMKVKNKIGVKMCEEISTSLPGCRCFRFSPVFLTCILVFSKCRIEDLKVNSGQGTCSSGRPLTCKRITTKRRGIVLTGVAVANLHRVEDDTKDIGHSNLLVVSQIRRKIKLQLYNPDTDSFAGPVTYCPIKQIQAAIYVKTMNAVLLAHKSTAKLKIMYFNATYCLSLKLKINCRAMKYHNRKKRIYLIPRINKLLHVYTMKTDSSEFRLKLNIKKYKNPTKMALDEKRDLIYVAVQGAIISFTTDGEEVKRRVTCPAGSSVSSLCLGSTGLKLFFAQRKIIREFNTLTNSTRILTTCFKRPFIPTSLVWFRDRIYVSSFTSAPYFCITVNETCKKRKLYSKGLLGIYLAPPI